jgi:uncharacterized protein involved in exopolysaccharide biosynthesis
MTYADLLWAIRYRWKLIVGIMAAIVLAVVIWTAMTPRIYSATASVLFDDMATDAEPGANPPQASAMANLLGTQADIVRSEAVASQVVRDLALDRRPALTSGFIGVSKGAQLSSADLVSVLMANLVVTPDRNTNVMAIAFNARDPELAALVANGFADAFVKTQLRLRTKPAKLYSDWVQKQTRDVRARFEEAQARLTRFQQARGLMGGQAPDVEVSHLNDLSARLAEAEGYAADMRSRAANGASPDVQLSPAVSTLRGAIATQAAQVQQLSARLGPQHPQMMAAQASLDALNDKLRQAIAQAAQSARAASSAAGMREAEVRGRVASQRQRALAVSNAQDQALVLQRDVDVAKAAYDAVTQRLNGARLKAAVPQTRVSVLDRASPSYYPVSPDVAMRIGLGLLFGLLVGLGLAALAEWLAPRVRTSAGLRQTAGLSTLVNLADYRRSAGSYDRGATA